MRQNFNTNNSNKDEIDELLLMDLESKKDQLPIKAPGKELMKQPNSKATRTDFFHAQQEQQQQHHHQANGPQTKTVIRMQHQVSSPVQPQQQQQQQMAADAPNKRKAPARGSDSSRKARNRNEKRPKLHQQCQEQAQEVGDVIPQDQGTGSEQQHRRLSCEASAASSPSGQSPGGSLESSSSSSTSSSSSSSSSSSTTAIATATAAARENICAACLKPIKERYLLMALDKQWHEDCLKCACCDCRLGEVGSSLFTHSDKILCRRDFLRIFGRHGLCAACKKSIPPYEMVMRANQNAYHMDCFACQQCQYRFCVGDRFHLTEAHKIVCLYCHSDQQQQQQQHYHHLRPTSGRLAGDELSVSTRADSIELYPSAARDDGQFSENSPPTGSHQHVTAPPTMTPEEPPDRPIGGDQSKAQQTSQPQAMKLQQQQQACAM